MTSTAGVLGGPLRLRIWALAVGIGSAPDRPISFTTYLYLSGTTFFTLGLGDVTPMPGVGRVLVVTEVALGFIFLALVISYVPIKRSCRMASILRSVSKSQLRSSSSSATKSVIIQG
jgi:hypothetical protein